MAKDGKEAEAKQRMARGARALKADPSPEALTLELIEGRLYNTRLAPTRAPVEHGAPTAGE